MDMNSVIKPIEQVTCLDVQQRGPWIFVEGSNEDMMPLSLAPIPAGWQKSEFLHSVKEEAKFLVLAELLFANGLHLLGKAMIHSRWYVHYITVNVDCGNTAFIGFHKFSRSSASLKKFLDAVGLAEELVFPMRIKVASEELDFELDETVKYPYLSGSIDVWCKPSSQASVIEFTQVR